MYSPWVMTSFTTLAQPQALPFETTFSDNVQWQSLATPSCPNAWCIGSATSEDLNGQSAYISKDGGISYGAETNSTSFIAYLYKDFSFGQTNSSFELRLLVLTLHNDTCGDVRKADSRVGGVHRLTTGARCTEDILADVVHRDLDIELLGLRQYSYRGS